MKLGKLDDNNAFELCQNTIKNVYLLIDTIDKKRNTAISKDLDYLYKHCLLLLLELEIIKIMNFDGCIQILSDITEGWTE